MHVPGSIDNGKAGGLDKVKVEDPLIDNSATEADFVPVLQILINVSFLFTAIFPKIIGVVAISSKQLVPDIFIRPGEVTELLAKAIEALFVISDLGENSKPNAFVSLAASIKGAFPEIIE